MWTTPKNCEQHQKSKILICLRLIGNVIRLYTPQARVGLFSVQYVYNIHMIVKRSKSCLCSTIQTCYQLTKIFLVDLWLGLLVFSIGSTGFLLPKWNADVKARVRVEKVFLVSRATVFDQIYVFYLPSTNSGISGPAFDDIYALEHTTKHGARERV